MVWPRNQSISAVGEATNLAESSTDVVKYLTLDGGGRGLNISQKKLMVMLFYAALSLN